MKATEMMMNTMVIPVTATAIQVIVTMMITTTSSPEAVVSVEAGRREAGKQAESGFTP